MAIGSALGDYRLGQRETELRHELLVQYYESSRDAIEPILEEHLAQGHRIAIWCGGKAGGQPESAFTQVFDPNATKIACLCRAKPEGIAEPQEKYPMMRHTEADADVVLYLANNPYRAVGAFAKAGLAPEHVIVEAKIWEHVTRSSREREASIGKTGSTAVAEAADATTRSDTASARGASPKTCSLTILYNPNDDVVKAVGSYAGKVDKAYVFDNSPSLDEGLKREIEALGNVEYLFGGGINQGICAPVNIVAAAAKTQGFDWLITFDQDSQAGTGMIEEMVRFIGSAECGGDIALVAPYVNKTAKPLPQNVPYPATIFTHHAIQSGLAHRLSAFDLIGGYDERLFIDEVENDYCARTHAAGFQIIRLNKAVLLHQVHDTATQTRRFVNKYSPARFYYRTRNILHMLDTWRDANPKYAADCARGLAEMLRLTDVDKQAGDKISAMMLGYLHHAQGKWPTYGEALIDLKRPPANCAS